MKPKTDFSYNAKSSDSKKRDTYGWRYPLNHNGKRATIGNRIFLYFAVFTIGIMLALWLLQILFFQTFYQIMKVSELKNTASTIEESYGKESFYATISTLTYRSDIFVQVESHGFVICEAGSNPGEKLDSFAISYNREILKQKLKSSGSHSITDRQRSLSGGNYASMIYASVLGQGITGENIYLFIYAPLTAVGSTIDILAQMLIIITILSIIFGLIMSIIISKRLAKPIINITASAAELACGNYSTTFDGTGYAETEELAATLNYAADELSKTDKLQKDLIANVSHDLKTPLTMVKSYAEMVRDLSGDNPEKRQKHLQVIINEADRLNELVNDLTKLSKMQANVDNISLETIDLRTIAKESIDSFYIHSEQDGFKFELNIEGSTEVSADGAKIRQVFANLIGNAIRYSSDDKRIIVNLTEQNDYVRCEITDFGQGIDAKDLTAVWDRYYRSSSNHSRNSSGSGLGLAIVKQIFILHGAKYGVISQLNEGSTFWFELKKVL